VPKFTVEIDEVVTYRITVEADSVEGADAEGMRVYQEDYERRSTSLVSVTNVEVVNIEEIK
jgi:hypothetical protein